MIQFVTHIYILFYDALKHFELIRVFYGRHIEKS